MTRTRRFAYGYDSESGQYLWYGPEPVYRDEVSGLEILNGRGVIQYGRRIDGADPFSKETIDPQGAFEILESSTLDPSLGRAFRPCSYYED